MISYSIATRSVDDPKSIRERNVFPTANWQFQYAINGRFLGQPVTGVQRYAREVVRALDEIVSERNGCAEILAPRLAESPHYKSIRVSTVAATKGYIWEQCELPLRARRPLLSLCNVGPIAAAEQILCVHDLNVFHCPESYSRSFRMFYRAFLPRMARRASRLTTVSQASRKEISDLFSLTADDIVVLPNGHEHVLNWRPERSLLKEQVSGFRPFVMTIGSAAMHKNIGLVLALAEALESSGIDIVVAGGSASIFAKAPKARAPNVHFLGRVSDDDLGYLYGRALCLAFPSRSEGFGLPLLEAMAIGCPVVAAPIPSSLEVCGDSALFAAPDDGEDWLRSLEKIARSAELRAEMAGRGLIRARAFSWRTTAQRYFDLATSGRL